MQRLTLFVPILICSPYTGAASVSRETPSIVQRQAIPFVAIRTTETMSSMSSVFPRLMPELRRWAAKNHVSAAGPAFIRFVYVDMTKGLDIEIGFPVAKSAKGDDRVTAGFLAAGRYVSLTHFGNYAGLVPPNATLQAWANKKHLRFKMTKGAKGEEFVSRVELYKTDPDKQPDPAKWETEILYMIE